MGNKIRLVGGPLSGRVVQDNTGRETVIVVGHKKMSRKALADWLTNYTGYRYVAGVEANRMIRPTVTAEYRKARVMVAEGTRFMDIPCVHPDGSYFYQYVRTIRDDSKP